MGHRESGMGEPVNSQNPQSQIPKRPLGLLVSLLVLAVGLALCFAFSPTAAVQSESLAVPVEGGRQLVARLFVPKTSPAPHPVMVLCHGVNASKEVMTPLAVELARSGIAAIAFDFSGMGESSRVERSLAASQNIDDSNLADARAVLAYLRSHPERFDSRRLGIGGHSMGGTVALELPQLERQMRAAIALSMSGQASSTVPKNLFLGVGVYEQLNPPPEVKLTLQQATGQNLPAFQLSGDFAAGTARQMAISTTADHVIAPYDPFLLQQAVSWAQRALQVPGRSLTPVFPRYILGLLVTFCGALAAGVFMFLRTAQPIVYPPARQLYRRCVAFLIAALMGVIWGLGSSGGPSRSASNLLILCYFLLLLSNYAGGYPEKFIKAGRVAGLYGVLFLGAFVVPALISGSGEIVRNPAYLAGLPQFLLQWPLFLIYNYTTVFKLAFFPAYTLNLQPSWLFLTLVFVELAQPGLTLTGLERGGVWGVRWLRQPLTVTGTGKFSRRSLALAGALLLVLGAIVCQRIQQGVLSLAANSGGLVLLLNGQMLLLPIAAIIFILRSRWFRRLERLCLGTVAP